MALRVNIVEQAVQAPGEVLGFPQLAVYCPLEQEEMQADETHPVGLYCPLDEKYCPAAGVLVQVVQVPDTLKEHPKRYWLAAQAEGLQDEMVQYPEILPGLE